MIAKRKRSHNRRERLRLDDFDDVQYSVEVVRLGEPTHAAASDAVSDRVELAESTFVVLVGVAVIAGAITAGVVALETTTALAREALWYLLPMVLLPVVWFGVLHAWEKMVLTPETVSVTDGYPVPAVGRSSRNHRPSKVAIY